MHISSVTIKKGSFEQAYEVHRQIPEFNGDKHTPDFMRKMTDGSETYSSIAYIDEKAVGYMISFDRYKDGSIYCWLTGVKPDFRQHGALGALFEDLEICAKEKGYRKIVLRTLNRFRSMIISLTKLGFMFVNIEEMDEVTENRIQAEKLIL